jgi:septum formation protein
VITLYLASSSPARLNTLRQVGLSPVTLHHEVDEHALVARKTANGPVTPSVVVQMLAEAKAVDACGRSQVTGLVLGGDSLFEIDGEIYGKPHTADVATQRWLGQRGKTGILHSGHFLADCVDGKIRAVASITTQTAVRFVSDMTDEEVRDYVATGEPLQVAGAFTIDARGAAFIEEIDGDPYTVVGLSVVALRQLVHQLGYRYVELWQAGKKPLAL